MNTKRTISQRLGFTPENSSWCGNPQRGAAMGRASRGNEPTSNKFFLCHLVLDQGGCDVGGAYWGHGLPIYYYRSTCGEVCGSFRLERGERNEAALALYWGDRAAGIAPDHAECKRLYPDEYAVYTSRNKDRARAKQFVLELYPDAVFFC